MTAMNHGLSRLDRLLFECLNNHALNEPGLLPQTFGYLLGPNEITGNLSKEAIVDGFDALVETMRTTELVDGPADAGMTFLGQFIDHDVTFDATSAIGSKIDPRSIRNIRTPGLDLDCVYGDGPGASPHLYSRDLEGFMLFGREDSPHDLPRNCEGIALIGDPRNDENILISQVHGAFIALHNILMSLFKNDSDSAHDMSDCAAMNVRSEVWQEVVPPRARIFETVRRFIRLHYQWLVLHDFLPSFVDPGVIKAVLDRDPFGDGAPIMPAEFSVAAFRFGHSTVRPSYDLSKAKSGVDLFDRVMIGAGWRGPEIDIEMGRFFSAGGAPAQKALPVGPKIAATLFDLPDHVVKDPLMWGELKIKVERAKKLALRNILRDRTAIRIASGQQMARHLRIPELPTPEVLKDHHIDKTPLWFYCLQEAGESSKGRLTGVGGAIVASVIVRLLKLDRESVLNTPDFVPWSGFGEKFTMGGLMHFVETHRDTIPERAKLYCKRP
ncbi:hypothetical protein GRZ55_06565 [Chelativorans sp. ZYF759]|uniref:peroxidase family protein n=1 Tax=Chelativorans sp. ZYF759 TaxID=2692213 RepID=UPI00145F60DF|nr:peroxidase family protein [Chelativorans sp. ZYF759]NMG38905.1 hypothetical protein [Chelativorans sp. ZYF759]